MILNLHLRLRLRSGRLAQLGNTTRCVTSQLVLLAGLSKSAANKSIPNPRLLAATVALHSTYLMFWRRRFMDIMRQVRFSIRSALGSCDLVLLYNFHICAPNGSLRCSSSGDSASSRAKTESRSRPFRPGDSMGEISSLLSMVLADVSECTADDVDDEAKSPLLRLLVVEVGNLKPTCRGELPAA